MGTSNLGTAYLALGAIPAHRLAQLATGQPRLAHAGQSLLEQELRRRSRARAIRRRVTCSDGRVFVQN